MDYGIPTPLHHCHTYAPRQSIRFGDWTAAEVEFLNQEQFITAKPVVYLVNLSEQAFVKKKNKWLPKIYEWVQANGGEPIIPFSGAFESRLAEMPDDERAKYEKEVEVSSALAKIITTGFKAINLIYFFTAGSDEVKCWQIRKGLKAPQVKLGYGVYVFQATPWQAHHAFSYATGGGYDSYGF